MSVVSMFIHAGISRYRPRKTGFRNDFCLACAQPRRAFKIRTLDFLTLFWIPVLPLGPRDRWLCATCGKEPHANVRTRPVFLIAGIVLLLLAGLLAWTQPIGAEHATAVWILRIAAPLGALATALHLARRPREPSLRRRLEDVAPTADTVCPVCGVALVSWERWSCPRCKMRRLQVHPDRGKA